MTLKTDFTRILNHELKQPVTVIRGYIDLLAGKQYGPLTGTVDRVLTKINDKFLTIQKMIDQYSHGIAAGIHPFKLMREPVLMQGYVKNCLEEMKGIATHKKQRLTWIDHTTKPVTCEIDRLYMASALLNLIKNAIKYTPKGGRISLELAHNRDFPGCIIHVKDNGPGIEEKHLTRIFQLHYRVDKKEQGMGIGLYLAEKIIRQHGGKISVQSIEGEGSVFTIILPGKEYSRKQIMQNINLNYESNREKIRSTINFNNKSHREDIRPHLNLKNKSNIKEIDPEKKMICIVDDNPGIRELLSEILIEKYNLISAENGADALNSLSTGRKPDLILLDMVMPEMNGIEFFTEYMTDEKNRDVAVIFITAGIDPEADQEALSVGGLAIIRKPFTSDTLLIKIENLLNIKSIWQKQYIEKVSKILDLGTGIKDSTLSDERVLIILKNYKHYGISEGEKRVLELLRTGEKDMDIAEKLFLSKKTVGNHVSNMLEKTDSRNRVELVYKIYMA